MKKKSLPFDKYVTVFLDNLAIHFIKGSIISCASKWVIIKCVDPFGEYDGIQFFKKKDILFIESYPVEYMHIEDDDTLPILKRTCDIHKILKYISTNKVVTIEYQKKKSESGIVERKDGIYYIRTVDIQDCTDQTNVSKIPIKKIKRIHVDSLMGKDAKTILKIG